MTQTRIKIFLFILWSTVVCLVIYIYFSREYSIIGIAETLKGYIRQNGVWGPLIYVTAYAFRSLIFFPASILTITAGILFGPWLGILLTMIGENISANISFVVGRYFTADLLKYFSTKKRYVTKNHLYRFDHSKELGFLKKASTSFRRKKKDRNS